MIVAWQFIARDLSIIRIRPVGCGMIWVGLSPYNPRLNKDGLPTSRPVVNHGAQNHTIPPGRIVYGHTFLAVNRQATINSVPPGRNPTRRCLARANLRGCQHGRPLELGSNRVAAE